MFAVIVFISIIFKITLVMVLALVLCGNNASMHNGVENVIM